MIRSSIIHIFLALFRRHESFAAVCCCWCVRSGWIIATVWDKAGYRSIAFTTINQNKIFTFWQTRRAKSEHQEVGNSLKKYSGIQHIVSEFYVFWKKGVSVVCLVWTSMYYLWLGTPDPPHKEMAQQKNEKSSFYCSEFDWKRKACICPTTAFMRHPILWYGTSERGNVVKFVKDWWEGWKNWQRWGNFLQQKEIEKKSNLIDWDFSICHTCHPSGRSFNKSEKSLLRC